MPQHSSSGHTTWSLPEEFLDSQPVTEAWKYSAGLNISEGIGSSSNKVI